MGDFRLEPTGPNIGLHNVRSGQLSATETGFTEYLFVAIIGRKARFRGSSMLTRIIFKPPLLSVLDEATREPLPIAR